MNKEMRNFINDINNEVVTEAVKEKMIETNQFNRFFEEAFSQTVGGYSFLESTFVNVLALITPMELIEVYEDNGITLDVNNSHYFIKHEIPELEGEDLGCFILDKMKEKLI